MFKDFKNALKDNYGLYSIFVFCFLLILFLGNVSFRYYFSYNEFIFADDLYYPSSVFLLWNLFAFFVWSFVKRYKENPNSKWLLTYLLMILLYNPIYRISAHHSFKDPVSISCIILTLLLIIDKKYYVMLLKFLINKFVAFVSEE